MQSKLVFISDRLKQFHSFIRRENSFEYSMDLLNHAEANRRYIFRTYYDLFILDLNEPWLALPPWIKEQAQHHYYFHFVLISDGPVNPELENLLRHRIFTVIDSTTAADQLDEVVDKARKQANDHRYIPNPELSLKPNYYGSLLGNHASIKRINQFIKIVGKARFAPCLISGETGTGRNLCARLIHKSNDLRDDLFFIKNCEGTTTNELLGDLFGVQNDSEIYGPKRLGLLELYSGGTLVLKNIEKIPLDVQDKLLLYLENRVVKPLDSENMKEANTRIIGTTKHNLEWFVKRQNFNSGLFYHLNAFEIHLPPLRERIEDIPLITKYYLQYFSHYYGKEVKGISAGSMKLIKEYPWAGNVRELKDVLERAVFASGSEKIVSSDLPDFIKAEITTIQEEDNLGNCSIKDMERIHIERILGRTNGNKSKAAGILDISRTTLREKMRVYGILA